MASLLLGEARYGKLRTPAQDSITQIDSIKSVIQNYGHYKDIAEKGREHIINTFNWLKITEEYEKTIFKTIEDFKNANI